MLLLTASLIGAAFYGGVISYGNLTVAYEMYPEPAVEMWVDGCLYYVIRWRDPKVVEVADRAREKRAEVWKAKEEWRKRFMSGAWLAIAKELRAANYSGYLDFYYCCSPLENRTLAEGLSKASTWVNRTLRLIDEVSRELAAAGAEVAGVYVSVWEGFVGINVFADPGKGTGNLATVMRLNNIFNKYRDLPLFIGMSIIEVPLPSPYIKGADDETVVERLGQLKRIIFKLYEEVGMSVDPRDVVTGISGRQGLVIMLIAPPDEMQFLKELTKRTKEMLGMCPNGSSIHFFKTGSLVLTGYSIAWHSVALKLAVVVAIALGAVYLARRYLH